MSWRLLWRLRLERLWQNRRESDDYYNGYVDCDDDCDGDDDCLLHSLSEKKLEN
jgi:hypothetical protein